MLEEREDVERKATSNSTALHCTAQHNTAHTVLENVILFIALTLTCHHPLCTHTNHKSTNQIAARLASHHTYDVLRLNESDSERGIVVHITSPEHPVHH